ncbi:MAG: hypothetical protein KF912_09500 [Phycisphaeraceae bacterium]|nr:hypothetical protein [Phycisphaeraceae bacterium]MBX3367529.1 hypothetical protein [Phycisphaeraceae bacterium]
MSPEDKHKFIANFRLYTTAATFAFRRTLSHESDRGVVLMAAAHLDDQLKELLSFILVDDVGAQQDLLSSNGGCSTFSSRIALAYLLGLISKKVYRDLTLIRKIRNDFAHVATPIALADATIANRCRELSWCGDDVADSPRNKFVRCAIAVLAELHSAYLCVPCIRTRPEIGLNESQADSSLDRPDAIMKAVEAGTLNPNDSIAMATAIAKAIGLELNSDNDNI